MTSSPPATPPPSAQRPRQRQRPWLCSLALALGLAVLGGLGWWAWTSWGAARPGSERQFATVQRGDIEDLVGATGSLQPRDYVDVGAQVSGQLKKIHVEVGDRVTAGQLLADIDAEQAAARVEANRASLRAQQATLTERQSTLAQAQRSLQRQRNLAVESATTTAQVEDAETAVRSAQAQTTALQAQIAQAQASMRVDEANLRFTRIFAPMAGTVVSITARQGQTLNTNQSAPTLLRIADLSTMTVQTQVSEADVSKLTPGMPSYFTTLGSQGQRWQGTLRKIEPTPTVTNNVVLFNALFDVPNPTGRLMSNMTAQVFFVVAEARDVLMAPVAALNLDRTGTAARRTSNAGARSAGGAASGTAGGTAGGNTTRITTRSSPGMSPGKGPGDPGTALTPAGPAGSAGSVTDATPRVARAGRPRAATVQVLAADGTLQPRAIQVGVSNRISVQVLSGLQAGEQVLTGIRQPAAAGAPRPAAAGLGGTGGAAGGAGGRSGAMPGGPGGR